MTSELESLQQHRHLLYDRFAIAQVAVSADGHEVPFAGPMETGVRVGGFAVVEDDTGARVVVQVRKVEVVEKEGPELDVDLGEQVHGFGVSAARARPMVRAVHGRAVTLGEFDGDRFNLRGRVEPFGERPIRPATPEEVAAVAAGLSADGPAFDVGAMAQAPEVAARLQSPGFGRHTFMCGQSGSGKTYTTGGLLERLLASTTLPILVIDPNSDHVFLGEVADPDDDSPAAVRHRAVAAGVHVARARGFGSPITLCIDFSDLDVDTQALLLQMHPVRDLDDYHALREVTATLTAPYSVAEVAAAASSSVDGDRLAKRIANLGIVDWELWRRDGERSAVEYDIRASRCVVVDVGSLATADERTAIVLALLGRRWAARRSREPVLMVIDEAHNVLPAVTDNPLLAATAELGILIAGEGRKFGLHLFVATQRPGKVHPNVVSQCDNLVLMRMNGSADIAELAGYFSHVPEPMLAQATGFGLGEALFAGPIAPVALLAKVGRRVSPQGGGDVPTTWAEVLPGCESPA
ncbi:ATP-binding protein [Rhodococcus sp. NPDC003322]